MYITEISTVVVSSSACYIISLLWFPHHHTIEVQITIKIIITTPVAHTVTKDL